ncbi:glycosyltransferase family 4 protein [Rhodococcus sp. IEGM 1401]|uniref:glycosyltransferase family 4 protein n=1 Tax=unclassified Rhodococcus (in: high G+C Gram-positive bacteria) TaxID=192944 RepID=UPI0022B423DF|nr:MULTISPECIES: glycosyltransferase family 4 protein [unclassified Rhodococcus (in: high G+C Gram-positive bacteria)]MCZ4560881.1 glycosyltransferase family 4 protein [Rhodococcus sp. IEGM 1401]MDI9921022.1 glycosyltransferase family 4 protein [Rhodococcus sp. IEGM 1372]MDV8033378.1 glycosyltransferase family 4 protein [Rhodococcus sp. IEGM 1414]
MANTLYLTHSAIPAGAELHLMKLLEHADNHAEVSFAVDGPVVDQFRQRGIDVDVFGGPSNALSIKRADTGSTARLRALVGLVRYGWELGAQVRQRDCTLIVAWTIKSLLYGTIASKRARVPLVWCVNDRLSPEYFGRAASFVLSRLATILPRAFIVNSRATLDTVDTHGKPVLIAPPGLTVSGEQRVRSAVTIVTMVGRIAPWKGQLEFVRAFDAAFAGTDVRAVVVGGPLFGEDEYFDDVRAAAAASPSAQRISFTGHVENVGELLLESDVLVHASIIPEPFGAVVLEGLAAGNAVVATRPGGPAEVITDGQDGLLTPCGDVAALTDALERLRDNPALVERLSSAATTRARDYDMEAISRSMQTWLDTVLDKTARGVTSAV